MVWGDAENSGGTADPSTRTQINQIPADPGSPAGATTPPSGSFGGQQDLVSSPRQKTAAARAIEDHIEPNTRQAGSHSDEETSKAAKAFDAKDGHGWLISSALRQVHKAWGEQVQGLMNRLSSEKGALRSANTSLSNPDFGVRSELQKVRTSSAIDMY
ncbi:hypothetical protein ABR738_13895 [Streptomyces sp. Edi4]|uniref:hypothetical protein n=1 Tax=Streptomyces sp. Edi4 TaxID=3162527 RepID=UPI0033066382